MDAILDFTRDLDVTLLDRVVQVMYQGAGTEVHTQQLSTYATTQIAALFSTIIYSAQNTWGDIQLTLFGIATTSTTDLNAITRTSRRVDKS